MMSSNPYDSPKTRGQLLPDQVGYPISTILKWIGGIGAVLFLLIVLLLPARRSAGEAARRIQCTNNLKHIGLALHNYHDTYGALPPAYTADEDGRPLHSWRTLLLPFMEGANLYAKINLSKPWDDPVNAEFAKEMPRSLRCPSIAAGNGRTSYLAVVGPNACLQATQSRSFSEITDGTGATLIVVEVDAEHDVPWMSPNDLNETAIENLSRVAKKTHSGGSQVLMADGSVQFLSHSTSAETLHAMTTIAGNDSEEAITAD